MKSIFHLFPNFKYNILTAQSAIVTECVVPDMLDYAKLVKEEKEEMELKQFLDSWNDRLEQDISAEVESVLAERGTSIAELGEAAKTKAIEDATLAVRAEIESKYAKVVEVLKDGYTHCPAETVVEEVAAPEQPAIPFI